jgi:hypothetical protein
MTIEKIFLIAFALDRKVCILLYDDNDENHEKGPIFSDVFNRTWELAGKPHTQWDVDKFEDKVTK